MPKDKKKSELALARKGKVGHISIIGDIGWDWFGMSYKGFRDKIDELGDVSLVEVDITSRGGVVVDGVAIMNTLIELGVPVHVYVNGEAASIATVIAMGGDKIFMPDNSLFFVHKPLNGLLGNADDMRKMADDLDKFETAIVNSYMRHFKGKEEEIKALMTGETWMTADEVADKFNNVTVLSSGGQQAAAHSDPVAVFGDPKASNQFLNGDTVPTEEGNNNEEVAMTPEEKAQMIKETAEAVVASLKEQGLVAAKATEAVPATEVPSKPDAKKVDVPFEGDMSDPEAVKAHAQKVKMAEIQASADMSTSAGVMAYHEALAKLTKTEEVPDAGSVPSNADASTGLHGAEPATFTPEACSDTVKRMTGQK